jgi:uncharacterized surface anchored protein
MKRNILILFFSLSMLLLLPVEAQALERNGSIAVTVLYESTAVPGGEMTLYPVGSSAIPIGEGDDWEKNAQEMAQELAAYVSDYDGTTQTLDSQGRTVFRHLDEGVYLLVQTKAAEGYLAANPFLVTLSAGESVVAYPKIQPLSLEEPDATPTPTSTPTSTPKPTSTPTPKPTPTTPGTVIVTPKPSTSPEPSASPAPEESPKPSQKVDPEESPKPSEITEESPKPSGTPDPEASPAPSGTTDPEESPTPSDTTEPEASPAPSEAVAVSPAPSVSPAISPEPSPTVSGEKKTLTNPFTGDEIDLRFWASLVGACLIALALILLTGKRNKHS